MICEICGARSPKLRRVIVEGSVMNVCPDCFNTLTKKTPVESMLVKPSGALLKKPVVAKPAMVKRVEKKTPVETVPLPETMELVDNYKELIKNRRRELGWSEEDLGEKTGLKTSLVKKIESGKITPSLVDIRKIEDALKIKLLKTSTVREEKLPTQHLVKKPSSTLTLGDVLRDEAAEQ
ncbi:MAG: TIGR00270 family protein [Thaumarchaeota archaeon]|jgi:putative transcription factor|nr:TIGR00270 family protein [Nitrososphaerota archaeon]